MNSARISNRPYFATGSDTRNDRTFPGSNPGRTCWRATKLRTINPAPISSTSVRATSATMSMPRMRTCAFDADGFVPARSVRFTSTRAARSAGMRPNASAVAALTPTANSRTFGSIRIVSTRGRFAGFIQTSQRVPSHARKTPSNPPQSREHQALRRQLPQQPAAARAKRPPHRQLTFAGGGAREQQVGDVRAGNQQEHADGAEERDERGPHVLDDILLQCDGANPHPRRFVDRVLRTQLRGDRFEVGLRLRQCHARLHPAEDREEREVARRLVRVVELQRLPDLRVGHEEGFGRQPQASRGRQHADDCLITAVEPDATADDRRIAAVPRHPEPMTEDHDVRPAHRFFFGGEVTAVKRIDAHGLEEVGGDRRDIHSFDVAAVGESTGRADEVAARGGPDRFEELRPLLVVLEVTGRHRRQRLCADAEVDPQVHHASRFAITERAHEDAADDAEDRRRRADAEAEREDGYGGETGRASQHAQRVAQILERWFASSRLYQPTTTARARE